MNTTEELNTTESTTCEMTTFEEEIQQWVSIDNKIKQINAALSQLKEQRNKCEANIIEYKNKNNMPTNVEISDGTLQIVNTKIPVSLSYKYIDKTLKEIIPNEEQVQQIVAYLKDNRKVSVVEEIKRTYFK